MQSMLDHFNSVVTFRTFMIIDLCHFTYIVQE